IDQPPEAIQTAMTDAMFEQGSRIDEARFGTATHYNVDKYRPASPQAAPGGGGGAGPATGGGGPHPSAAPPAPSEPAPPPRAQASSAPVRSTVADPAHATPVID